MKNKYIVLILALFVLAVHFSCKKMDDTYKHFVVPGGIHYIGKAVDVHVFPGRKRVKLTWLRGTDSKTSAAVIYWNQLMDSLVAPVGVQGPLDSVSVWINDLAENTYNFKIYTRDDYGHYSVGVDALGQSYDSIYESTLLTRGIKSILAVEQGASILWYPSDTTCLTTQLWYLDTNRQTNTLYCPKDSASILLKGYAAGTQIRYQGLYQPTSDCLDTFYTKVDSVQVAANP